MSLILSCTRWFAQILLCHSENRLPNDCPKFAQTKKANPFGLASKPRVTRVGLVDATGLEPATPTMSRWCSNQLSYASAMEAHSTEKRQCVNTFITNPLKLRHFYRSEQRFIFRTGG